MGYSATLIHNVYGDLAGALTNGLLLRSRTAAGAIVVDTLGGFPIKENHHFAHFFTTITNRSFAASNFDVTFTMYMFTDFTKGVQLNGAIGDYFELYANDNFTGMVDHHFVIKGVRYI